MKRSWMFLVVLVLSPVLFTLTHPALCTWRLTWTDGYLSPCAMLLPHNTHVLAADGWQGEERGRLGHLFPGLTPCVVLCLTKPEPLPTDLSIR